MREAPFTRLPRRDTTSSLSRIRAATQRPVLEIALIAQQLPLPQRDPADSLSGPSVRSRLILQAVWRAAANPRRATGAGSRGRDHDLRHGTAGGPQRPISLLGRRADEAGALADADDGAGPHRRGVLFACKPRGRRSDVSAARARRLAPPSPPGYVRQTAPIRPAIQNSRVGRLVPRVDYGDAGCLEITLIPSGNRHAMHERSCCDEGIPIGAGIWHMERCASLGHSSINRQNSPEE